MENGQVKAEDFLAMDDAKQITTLLKAAIQRLGNEDSGTIQMLNASMTRVNELLTRAQTTTLSKSEADALMTTVSNLLAQIQKQIANTAEIAESARRIEKIDVEQINDSAKQLKKAAIASERIFDWKKLVMAYGSMTIAGIIMGFYVAVTYMQPSADTIAESKIKKEQDEENRLLRKYGITETSEITIDNKKYLILSFRTFKDVRLPGGEQAKYHKSSNTYEYKSVAIEK